MEFSINIGCNVSEEWTASQQITLRVFILENNLINIANFYLSQVKFVILKRQFLNDGIGRNDSLKLCDFISHE